MELLKIWRIILGYRWMIIVLTISATVMATLLTYALPVKYLATAVVLVRPKEAFKANPNRENKEILDFPLSHSAPIDAPSKTYMEIIQSRVVAERVVHALNLDHPAPKIYDSKWEEWKDIIKKEIKDFIHTARHIFKYGGVIEVSPFEKAVEDVQENLKMEAKKNTYIFMITYGSGDPHEAANVANELAKIFLEHTSESDKSEIVANRISLGKQLQKSAENLKQTREILKEFKEDNQTFLLKEEYKQGLKVITHLESLLEETETELVGVLEIHSPKSQEVLRVEAERDRLLYALSQKKLQLESHPNKEKFLETLALDVDAAEKNYKFLRPKYDEILLEETRNTNEIRIVSPASPPSYPSKPIKYYYGGAACITGLIIGIGWALFRESSAARFRSINEVKELLDTRVLATIPKMKA
jgi:uncharacterized protein involved in exopolysaccharide biosynthesis